MHRFAREACIVGLLIAFGGCAGGGSGCGGCDGCAAEQIPGGFPLENRVENAGQVRLTSYGIGFVEANLSEIVSQFLPDGLTFQIPQSEIDLAGLTATICPSDDCWVDVTLTDANLDPEEP